MYAALSLVNFARAMLLPFSLLVDALLTPFPILSMPDCSSYHPTMIPISKKLRDTYPKRLATWAMCGREGLSRQPDVPPCTSAQAKTLLGLSLTQAGLKHL